MTLAACTPKKLTIAINDLKATDKLSPLLSGTIDDGTVVNYNNRSPVISWQTATDDGLGVSDYEICLGSAAGSCDVQSFRKTGNVNSYQFFDLNLNDGSVYYANVRVLDAADNVSEVYSGNGWVVNLSLGSVLGVSSNAVVGSYKAGTNLEINILFSRKVLVVGTPKLNLETGATDRQAIYSSGSGTQILKFIYTVQAGDESLDLDYQSTTALNLDGGKITDIYEIDCLIELPAPGSAMSLAGQNSILIDTQAPVLVSGITNNLTYHLSYSTPPFSWSSATDGIGSGISHYELAVGSSAGQTDKHPWTNIGLVTTKQLVGLGNIFVQGQTYYPSLRAVDFAGNYSLVETGNGWVMDDQIPIITSVTSSTANGYYKTGQVISIQVHTSKVVYVSGNPRISMNVNQPNRFAEYVSGSGTQVLNFDFTIQAGDISSDLDYDNIGMLILNSGQIVDHPSFIGNLLSTTLPTVNSAQSVGGSKNIIVDTIAPVMTGAVNDGSFAALSTTSPTITWPAATDSGSSVAGYRFAIGTTAGGSDVVGFTDIGLVTTRTQTGLSFTEGATYYASVQAVDAAGNLSAVVSGDGWVYDTTPPTIQHVTSSTSNGSYKPGQLITLQVKFSENVIMTPGPGPSYPRLQLETGTTDQLATYNSGSGTDTLTFYYIVLFGDVTSDLNYLSTTALSLNSSAIRDIANNVANLTLPALASVNSLAGAKSIVIDTTAPTMTGMINPSANCFSSTSASPNFTWNAATDTSGGGISHYEIAIGSGSGQINNVKDWTNVGSGTSGSLSGLSLNDNIRYYPSIVAVDNAGNRSAIISNTTGWTADITGPVILDFVVDPITTKNSQTPWVSWSQPTDGAGCGFKALLEDTFEIAIGTGTSGANLTDVLNWTDLDGFYSGFLGYTLSGGFTLSPAQNYYLSLKVYDSLDNFTILTSMLPFTYSTSGWQQQALVKPEQTVSSKLFGSAIAVHGDRMVVGERFNNDTQTGVINGSLGTPSYTSINYIGAAYVYKRTGNSWALEAYLKPANANNANFGTSVDIFDDTIVVGATYDGSHQTTITNGTSASSDTSSGTSGAVYVFKRNSGSGLWAQEAYIKPSSPSPLTDLCPAGIDFCTNDYFGASVSISNETLVVGASGDGSSLTTISHSAWPTNDGLKINSGAVYVYKRSGSTWSQEAYIKAGNSDTYDGFGSSVDIDNDTLVVGSPQEASNLKTISNGITSSTNNSNANSGAAYVYKRTSGVWQQEAYIKASNNEGLFYYGFGGSVSISGDTIAVGKPLDASAVNTITNSSLPASIDESQRGTGAVFIYQRSGSTWVQESYIKPSRVDDGDIGTVGVSYLFGSNVSLSGDLLIANAVGDFNLQTTINNGTVNKFTVTNSPQTGAVYVYKRNSNAWAQAAYLKSSNLLIPNADPEGDNGYRNFGTAIGISGDTVVVSDYADRCTQTGVLNGPDPCTAPGTAHNIRGAAFVYKLVP